MNYLLVSVGGAIGAAARYFLSGVVYQWLPANFPYGTLIVNILGSFVIGFLMTSFEDRFLVAPGLRIFLTVGILGGFTTFSSFSFETVSLFRSGEFFFGAMNATASLLGCLVATFIGMEVGKIV